jgi:hypothetical protein
LCRHNLKLNEISVTSIFFVLIFNIQNIKHRRVWISSRLTLNFMDVLCLAELVHDPIIVLDAHQLYGVT